MSNRRKNKLTPELTKKVGELLEEGLYVETVCKAVGISTKTFYQWLNRGETEKKYAEFKKVVEESEAKFEERLVGTIKTYSIEDWKAAAWLLERRFPRRWSQHISEETTIEMQEGMKEFLTRILEEFKNGK